MADPRRDVNRPDAAQPPRRHGLLYNLLWGWPWALAGMVLSSLLLSLLIEYVGITFFWSGQGAGHSEAVMNTELGWLSSEFTRSLLLSTPSVTVMKWVSTAYQWLFVVVSLVAVVEGLGRRDLRRYGAAYESSFVYHHARKSIKPAIYIPCILYLSWPTAVYPNLLIWPAAMLLGVAITVTMASFKKYL